MSAVDAFAQELLELNFEFDPIEFSLLGIDGDHHRLPDLSVEAAARFRAAFADLAARVEALPATSVPGPDAVTREVVIRLAKAQVDTLDARLPDYSVSDVQTAPALTLLLLLPVVGLTDEKRARGHLARLAAVPEYLDTVIARHRAGLADGLVAPEFLVDAGIAYVDRYLADAAADPLRRTPDIEIDGFAEEQERLLAEAVRPAYRRYRDFLERELKPVAPSEEKAGLVAMPGGTEFYAGLIRVHTTTDRTAEDLHNTGLELIERLADEYRGIGSKLFGTSDLAQIFERLRTDPALRWSSGEELLDGARAAIARAEAVAPDWFGRVPEESCQVAAVPDTEAEGGTIAYYIAPSLDGSRPGVYYANTYEPGERFRHTSEAIAFHEAVPGHHFQISLALTQAELPLLRRIAQVNAYVEGWGLYAERLADEMGLYSGDLTRLGMLTQDSMRAGRLVVDTGLHALGWSRQQAVDYLARNTPMALLEIEAEIDRYAGCPAQALSYMVGRVEIQRLRAEAEKALGERFDIRAFHDLVIGTGQVPLPVLDQVVTSWIAEILES